MDAMVCSQPGSRFAGNGVLLKEVVLVSDDRARGTQRRGCPDAIGVADSGGGCYTAADRIGGAATRVGRLGGSHIDMAGEHA